MDLCFSKGHAHGSREEHCDVKRMTVSNPPAASAELSSEVMLQPSARKLQGQSARLAVNKRQEPQCHPLPVLLVTCGASQHLDRNSSTCSKLPSDGQWDGTGERWRGHPGSPAPLRTLGCSAPARQRGTFAVPFVWEKLSRLLMWILHLYHGDVGVYLGRH